MTALPRVLNKCPLVDALIELRFAPSPSINRNVVFALIYAQIKDLFDGPVVNLPLSQIPEQVRSTDPNLRFKPLSRIEGKSAILQVGTDVICISSKIPYIGWEQLSGLAIDVIRRIEKTGVLYKVLRLGHRYVNFFSNDILEDLSIHLDSIDGYSTLGKQFRIDLKEGEYNNAVQVSNTARYRPSIESPEQSGSLIDIDTSREYSNGFVFLDNITGELNNAHSSEKKLFYSLLGAGLLESLDPVYE